MDSHDLYTTTLLSYSTMILELQASPLYSLHPSPRLSAGLLPHISQGITLLFWQELFMSKT